MSLKRRREARRRALETGRIWTGQEIFCDCAACIRASIDHPAWLINYKNTTTLQTFAILAWLI